jgi:predicted transcriptional regulator
MKLKLNQIEKDDDIYPRQQISRKTIESYANAIWAGAKFPPIEVQRIRIVDKDFKMMVEEKIVCLDGWHRIEACRLYNGFLDIEPIEEIEVVFWKDEVLDKSEWLEGLRIESLQANLRHGLRANDTDVKFQAERIVDGRPLDKLAGVVDDLAKKFQIPQQRMSDLIGKRVKDRRASRDSKIYALSLLGWTQTEIGEMYGLTQPAVKKIITNTVSGKSNIQQLFYEQDTPVEKIQEIYKYSAPVLWADILDEKTDKERFTIFGKSEYQNDKPIYVDVLNFMSRDPRLGIEAPGNIAGQIPMNLMYLYTDRGDLVIDPMAGGGSTIDACLVMERKCRAYDLSPHPGRYDIIENDIRNGLPDGVKLCDLMFLDPPYYNKVEGISGFENPEEFYDFLGHLALVSKKYVKKEKHVVLLLSDYIDYEDGTKTIFAFRAAEIFEKEGLTCVAHFSFPLSLSQFKGRDIENARKKKIVLQKNRDCFVFRRAE